MDKFPEASTIVLDEAHASNGVLGVQGICCTCGTSDAAIQCQACGRVCYCTAKCLSKDAKKSGDEGHTKSICRYLQLCNEDEAAEKTINKKKRNAKNKLQRADFLASVYNSDAFERVQSEKQSFPATLSNCILDHPTFEDLMSQNRTLTIHVIGASDAELWSYTNSSDADNDYEQPVLECYRDALDDIVENFKSVTVHFIGPGVPKAISNKAKKNDKLHFELHSMSYEEKCKIDKADINNPPSPDLVVFFNPGFTGEFEEDWRQAFECVKIGTRFLASTNTELEAIAEIEHLSGLGLFKKPTEMEDDNEDISYSNANSTHDDDEDVDMAGKSFIANNPWCGSRVRQSDSFANDLYKKNYMLYGGTFLGTKTEQKEKIKKTTTKTTTKTAKRKRVPEENKNNNKKNNKKKSNPALI